MNEIWLDEDEQRTWRAFIQMHAQLLAVLAQGLKTDSDMSISDYEVLVILTEAPDGTLRARDLRCRLQWEKSRLAHHIRRMEQRGYVRRDTCTEDLRAPIVSITELGRNTIQVAAPAHVTQVRQLFFNALTRPQQKALREAAETVLK
ncbi:MarR family transcriptional regulator, partial [Actinomadura sp. GC306]|uniref:MarR family winged helix-turn-helix transcriptional regulator n=1 Tax=Actinomadura sp. GC306 TaxID=2530367 RepID=UPI00104EDD67